MHASKIVVFLCFSFLAISSALNAELLICLKFRSVSYNYKNRLYKFFNHKNALNYLSIHSCCGSCKLALNLLEM